MRLKKNSGNFVGWVEHLGVVERKLDPEFGKLERVVKRWMVFLAKNLEIK